MHTQITEMTLDQYIESGLLPLKGLSFETDFNFQRHLYDRMLAWHTEHGTLPMSFNSPVFVIDKGPLTGLALQPFYYEIGEGYEPFSPQVIPLVHPQCHIDILFTLRAFVEGADQLWELSQKLGIPVAIDTFTPAGLTTEDTARHFTWVDSPVVALMDDFEAYLASLKKKRRYKVKQALASAQELVLLDEPPTEDTILDIISQRFDDVIDIECVTLQYLYGLAAWHTNSDDVYWFKMGNQYSCFIRRRDSLIFLFSTSPTPSQNEGAELLVRIVEMFHMPHRRGQIDYIDPTCQYRVHVDELNTYKRVVCNKEQLRPQFIVGSSEFLDPEDEELALPAHIDGSWYFEEA